MVDEETKNLSQTTCPLCQAKDFKIIESIRVADLAALYEKMLKIPILGEFSGCNNLFFCLCGKCDLRFFYPLITGSEIFYEELQKQPRYYLDEKYEYEFARPYITEGKKVLEIGAGKGAFAKVISSNCYVGLEFSNKAIETAKAAGVSVIKQAVEEHAEVNREKYDVVCAFQVLEHISGVKEFVEASVTCLKNGGLLIYSIPAEDSYVSLLPNAILNMPPHHMTHWSDASLKNLTRYFPLELERIEHEPLFELHKSGFSTALASETVNHLLGRKYHLLETSLRGRAIQKITSLLSKFYLLGMRDPRILPKGHSVIAVYKKQ